MAATVGRSPAEPPPRTASEGDSSPSPRSPHPPGNGPNRPASHPTVVAVICAQASDHHLTPPARRPIPAQRRAGGGQPAGTARPAEPGAAPPPGAAEPFPLSGPPAPPTPPYLQAALAAQVHPVSRVLTIQVVGSSPAVAAALALRHSGALPVSGGFVWLLDETTVPAPDALDRLLAYAALDPGAAILGPALPWAKEPGDADGGVSWSAGLTVDLAGRRLPAPGPRQAARDVLAVSRSGMLVRADAWRWLGGLNPAAARADDLDLCWRAWRSGLRVAAVPSARMLPATVRPPAREDAGGADGSRAVARARVGSAPAPWPAVGAAVPAWGGSPTERADALRVRLAHAGPARWPLTACAIVTVAVLRALRALARARLGAARAEVVVAGRALADPTRLWRLSRWSARTSRVPARVVRPLLPRARLGSAAPPDWLEPAEPGAIPPPARPAWQSARQPWRRCLAPRPGVALAVLLAAMGLVASAVDAVRPPSLPPGADDLWAAVWSGWLGPAGGLLGGPGPAPAWTAFLALLASALGGKPDLAARVLLAGGPLLAGLAAYRATAALADLRGLAGGPLGRGWARAGLAAGYALAPPVTAAAAGGDVAAVGAAAAVPLVLAAALRLFAVGPAGAPRRPGWWPAWALAAALLVAVACAPGLLALAVVAVTAALVARWRGLANGRARWALAARVVGVLAVAATPLLPALRVAPSTDGLTGVLLLLTRQAEAGTVDGTPSARFGLFALVCVLAAAGAAPRAALSAVAGCWLLAAAGWVTGQDPVVVAALVAGVAAALLAPRPAPRRLARRARPVLSAVVLLVGPALLAALAIRGTDRLGTGPAADHQVVATSGRTLVLAPWPDGVTYTLVGGHGPTPLDAAGGTAPAAREFLAQVVADLVAGGGWGASALPALGVTAVAVLPDGTEPTGATEPPPTAGTLPMAAGPVATAAATADAAAAGASAAGLSAVGAGTPTLVDTLDAVDGLEREQRRAGGYRWRLAAAGGVTSGPRVLDPGLAASARTPGVVARGSQD
ncbi:MAG: glycosyltransferase family 2 protein, partial [Frankia sp.]|nr:glycosyltransferase family 2 protein [Frankia sp.]